MDHMEADRQSPPANDPVLDRRTFLKTTAAASVVFGVPVLGYLAKADEAASDPLPEALKQAKIDRKLVVAILVPATRAAVTITQGLAQLLASEDAAVRRIFCEAVFVCLDSNETARHFPKHAADGRALCLDASGKALDQCAFDGEMYGKKFVTSFRELIHGKDGQRLRDLAKEQRSGLSAADCAGLDKAVGKLGAAKFEEREAATKELLALAPRATAILALAQDQGKDPEANGRIGEVFNRLFAAAPSDKPGPRLPFGFVLRPGGYRFYDPCPPCGMGMIWPNSRLFLRAITGGTS